MLSMFHRATGEVDFQSGLHIYPHSSILTIFANHHDLLKIRTQRLSLKGWKRHVLGLHTSKHGTFEVEALTSDGDHIQVVLLSHRHPFYERDTPEDADRHVFHEGVVSTDLAGQKEFSWGEVLYRLEKAANKDWLVVAYSREAKMPLRWKEVLSGLSAQEDWPGEEGN